ncbi:MAG TPA: DeoR/GlpR family DNA-binding transcription regulator [Bryobacteraceae bacterium]|jgi:DeoR family transcriptional regulator of aga operon
MTQRKTAEKDASTRARLLTEERRRAILAVVDKQGSALISDLSKQFDVSAVTVRADINALCERDLLVRSHGGAFRASDVVLDSPVEVKAGRRHEEKLRIAQAAAALVKEGDIILLDSGTTTMEVSRAVAARELAGLTAITNSLDIAAELSRHAGISLIMIGGLLRHISRSFVGPQAERMLAGLHVDHLFLGVDGLDPNVGPSTPDVLEAELNAAMIRIARSVTVVTDASKIGQRSLCTISPITAIHRIITDKSIRDEHQKLLAAKGIDVVAV